MKTRSSLQQFYNSKWHVLSLSIMCMFLACTEAKDIVPTEKILVKIGDKSISVNEFIRRAEYTVRPPYCNGDFSHEKKIILNSLIAEKLVAITATDSNSFITDERIKKYIRGIKEQTMRQWLYEKDALGKVEIDTARINKTYKVAGRKYNISYFNLQDSESALKVKEEISSKRKSFYNVYKEFTGQDSLHRREVTWDSYENELVMDSLFSRTLTKGEVVGPIRVADDQFLMIKVNSWVNSPAISETEARDRWASIKEQFVKWDAEKKYEDIIYNVMKGKKLEFNHETFFKIVNILAPVYLRKEDETRESLKNVFASKPSEMEKYRDLQSDMEALSGEPLFKIDEKVWTVKDFSNELIAHPLVFRNKNLSGNNFAEGVKLAIADMVRDKYITEEAYERGYDKVTAVKRNVSMWRDNLNSEYYKMQFLNKTVSKSDSGMAPIFLVEKYLNPFIDSLQSDFSDVIEMDVEEFNKIKLTRVDMEVIRQNVPFSRVVPLFPWITTDSMLDYGKKM